VGRRELLGREGCGLSRCEVLTDAHDGNIEQDQATLVIIHRYVRILTNASLYCPNQQRMLGQGRNNPHVAAHQTAYSEEPIHPHPLVRLQHVLAVQ
jgi:hypothetical protein